MRQLITNWTVWVFLCPRSFIDPAATEKINFEDWTRRFDWDQDEWDGIKDYATPVRDTIEAAHGDCEDYALVAASDSVRRGCGTVGLGFCFDGILPSHVIAYDESRIYSSGDVREWSVEEYIDNTEYHKVWCRSVA